MFSCWVWELYQDCSEIFKKDGSGANGVENSSSKSHSSSIPSPIMRSTKIMGLLTCVTRCSQSLQFRLLGFVCYSCPPSLSDLEACFPIIAWQWGLSRRLPEGKDIEIFWSFDFGCAGVLGTAMGVYLRYQSLQCMTVLLALQTIYPQILPRHLTANLSIEWKQIIIKYRPLVQ
jgi:hypothetical protein